MTTPAASFVLGRRRASGRTVPSSAVRLTTRGERLAAVLVGVALIGAVWAAEAVGFWLTGVAG